MASAFDFDKQPSNPGRSARRRGRKNKSQSPGWLVPVALFAIAVVVIGGGLAAWKMLFSLHLELGTVAAQHVKEAAEVRVKVPVEGLPRSDVRWSLAGDAPKGSGIDASTGEFRWTPGEEAGGKRFPITVVAKAQADAALTAETHFTVTVEEVQQPPVLEPIADQTLQANGQLAVQVKAHDPDLPPQPLTYRLVGAKRPGLSIEQNTGYLRWKLAGVKAGSYDLTVQAVKPGGLQAGQVFHVRVLPLKTVVDDLAQRLRARGLRVELQAETSDPTYRGKGRLVAINGETTRVYEYPNVTEANEEARKTPPDEGLAGKPNVFQSGKLLLVYGGSNARVLNQLTAEFGQPIFVATGPQPVKAAPTMSLSNLPAEEKHVEDDAILELFTKGKLLVVKEYPTLRKLFATKFEKQYDKLIRQGFGSEYDAMMAWLNEHVDIKEDFFLAIEPEHDKMVEVFKLFRELKEKYPKHIEPYANLAIATAVTWDDKRGIYRYDYHARRTHSNLPDKGAGAMENFQYLIDNESVMQGRARYLPWEFLRQLVDHTTPIAERQWALEHFLAKRAMFGKCYSDVEYDHEMLKTNSKVCKLGGKDYTLANILKYGGVCAMQADFAARVGKSIGVPAAYVGGESRSGDLHAWVMWVELAAVTNTSVSFSLQSHGRYLGDRYYVGNLIDAQSGERTTDRELELQLNTVGMNAIFKRHAALAMQAFPMIRERADLDVTHQLLLLREVIHMSPGNEAAWTAVAKMSRGGQIKKANQKMMVEVLRAFFNNFAAFPDFTWRIFDDFIAYQEDVKSKAQSYETLVAMYEAAQRPDLACEARLKLTQYEVNEKKYKDAIAGLAFTIMKFPDEGRYVPKMLDELEAVCKKAESAGPKPGKKPDVSQADVVNFYKQFLPLVPQRRGDEPSPYAIEMLQRGIDRFKEAGDLQTAQACMAQLSKLKAP